MPKQPANKPASPRRTTTGPQSSAHSRMHWKNENPETVDPRWLMKALGVTAAVALLCAYLLFCALFSWTQWQYVLEPSRTATNLAMAGLNAEPVKFGVDASGQPQLAGWWLAASNATRPTVLMLEGAAGNISNEITAARRFHELDLNVLLFDFRGYGASGGRHPTQQLMQEDAHNAMQYLTSTRGVPERSIVVYGVDTGAAVALHLCATAQCAAMILDAPDGDLLNHVRHDPRTRIVPVRLLFHEQFPLAEPLRESTTPKLIISYGVAQAPAALRNAHDPKMLVELRGPQNDEATTNAFEDSVRRFLDEYAR